MGVDVLIEQQDYERRARPGSAVKVEVRPKPQLCQVKITDKQADKAVYGVYGGLNGDGDVQVYALGTVQVRVNGACEPGDLLRSSAVPGVAEVQPDDIIRASTLGKVTGRKGAGEGLVSAVLYSG